MRLGIVADDLTGAVDTGVQSAKAGLHTVVMLSDAELPPADVVVISTDSRDAPADVARDRAREAAQRLRDRTVYKKIDSTLRGNIGWELDGLLDGLGLGRALVAPAFPATGRTTVDGYHRVNGVLLSESPFARDPLWPASESHLPTLLGRQTPRSVGHLPLATVERGVEAVKEALQAEPAAIVVADAAEPRHLRTLARTLVQMENRLLPCGSAGLAEEWIAALGLEPRQKASPDWAPDTRPVLVLAGSRNEATALQLRRALQENALELADLPSAEGSWTPESLDRAGLLLGRGSNVALAATFSEYREGQGTAVAIGLARAAKELLARSPVAGLFMTGGDVARAACRELGATALRALGEVQPGVPAGLLVGGPFDGLRVVTKAGGFGDDLTIVRSIHCLQGRLK